MYSLLLLVSLLHARVLAQSSTCGFIGGYPLRDPYGCPSYAPQACGVGLEPKCCPDGFNCLEDYTTGWTYCCEPGQDCKAETVAHPQCPESTWNVWAYESDGSRGWCCGPNDYGFATLSNDGVGCQAIGEDVDTDLYHTVTQFFTQSAVCTSSPTSSTEVPSLPTYTVSAYSSIALTTTWPSSSSQGTQTPTSTSSFRNGTTTTVPTTTPLPTSSSSHLSVDGIKAAVVGAAAAIAFAAILS
ncbi:hypothetical protein F5Y16DRAFT_118433 [Xylariaceae sp. FL0255]|nr:hypothetical protein F5Y16DRAFT_118433 [Xylariaceae sp. FL0255]